MLTPRTLSGSCASARLDRYRSTSGRLVLCLSHVYLPCSARVLVEPDCPWIDTLVHRVDKNNDGVLSRAEFAHAIAVIKKSAADEVAKKLELEKGLEQSQRRSKFLWSLVLFLVPVVAILLAGNAGLVYGLLEVTKDTKINYHTGSGPTLTTTDGSQVAVRARKICPTLARVARPRHPHPGMCGLTTHLCVHALHGRRRRLEDSPPTSQGSP
jgi:hypothetical protein